MFNAVKSGSVEAVDILLSNGARTDVVDEVSVKINYVAIHLSFRLKAFSHLSTLDPDFQPAKIESSLVVFTLSYFERIKSGLNCIGFYRL